MPLIENLGESYLIFTKWVVFFLCRFGYFFVCIVLSWKLYVISFYLKVLFPAYFMHSIIFAINVYKTSPHVRLRFWVRRCGTAGCGFGCGCVCGCGCGSKGKTGEGADAGAVQKRTSGASAGVGANQKWKLGAGAGADQKIRFGAGAGAVAVQSKKKMGAGAVAGAVTSQIVQIKIIDPLNSRKLDLSYTCG